MPLSPIKPTEEPPIAPPRAMRLPLDPLLTLAVLGLGACSLITLRDATRNLIPGNPHYYVNRQAVYLIVGRRLHARALAHRLRAPAPVQKRRSTRC